MTGGPYTPADLLFGEVLSENGRLYCQVDLEPCTFSCQRTACPVGVVQGLVLLLDG